MEWEFGMKKDHNKIIKALEEFTKDLENNVPLHKKYKMTKLVRMNDGTIKVIKNER